MQISSEQRGKGPISDNGNLHDLPLDAGGRSSMSPAATSGVVPLVVRDGRGCIEGVFRCWMTVKTK
jgi:hypothetical protein